MDKTLRLFVLPTIVATSAVILVGLTLYTAYFGVFPDGIQRSAHLLLVMVNRLEYQLVFGCLPRWALWNRLLL